MDLRLRYHPVEGGSGQRPSLLTGTFPSASATLSVSEIEVLVYTHGAVTTAQARVGGKKKKKLPGAGFSGWICSVSRKTAPEPGGPSQRVRDDDARPIASANGT